MAFLVPVFAFLAIRKKASIIQYIKIDKCSLLQWEENRKTKDSFFPLPFCILTRLLFFLYIEEIESSIFFLCSEMVRVYAVFYCLAELENITIKIIEIN